MNAMPREKSRYSIRLKRTVMTETPSPHPHPPDTITQMTTVPILCTPVELHRHSESCQWFFKLSKPTQPIFEAQSEPRHRPQRKTRNFRTSGHSESCRGTSRSKRLKNPKREWCQRGWIN